MLCTVLTKYLKCYMLDISKTCKSVNSDICVFGKLVAKKCPYASITCILETEIFWKQEYAVFIKKVVQGIGLSEFKDELREITNREPESKNLPLSLKELLKLIEGDSSRKQRRKSDEIAIEAASSKKQKKPIDMIEVDAVKIKLKNH